MRTDHRLLIVGDEQTLGALAYENIEVVEPEIGHHLFELAFAVYRTQQLGLREFLDYDRGRIVHGLQNFFLPGIEALEKFLSLAASERIGECDLFVGGHGEHSLVTLVGRQVDESLNLQVSIEVIFAAAACGYIGRAWVRLDYISVGGVR